MNNEILYLDEFPFFLMYCEQRSVSPPAGIVCLYISICYHCDNSTLNHSTCRTDPSFIASKNILHLKPLLLVFILNSFSLFLIPQIFFYLKRFLFMSLLLYLTLSQPFPYSLKRACFNLI